MSTSPAAPSEWVWLARIRRPQGRKGEVFADILTDFPEKFAQRRHLWLITDEAQAAEKTGETGFVTTARIQSGQHAAQPKFAGFVTRARLQSGQRAAQSKETGFSPCQPAPGSEVGNSTVSAPSLAPSLRPAELTHHWLHKGGIVLHFAGIDSISAAETLAGLLVAIPRSERAPLPEDEVYIADLIGCTLLDVSSDPPLIVGAIEDVDRTAGPTPLLVLTGANGEVLIPFAKSYLRKVDLENRRVEMSLPEGLIDLNR